MSSYWSKACAAQLNRPLLQLQQANYAGCIFAASVTKAAKFTRVTVVLCSNTVLLTTANSNPNNRLSLLHHARNACSHFLCS